jgi:beta-lactam-binding protein with PASTA domain
MLVIASALLAGVAGGCGTAAVHPTQTRLSVSAPADGTRVTSGSIVVSGTVSPPQATVLVVGRSVPVVGGAFTTRVTLAPGQNILDVLAGTTGAAPAMTAVRVYRQVQVDVPSLSGDSASAAASALQSVGLAARIVDNEPFYGFLLPGSPSVCSTSPPAGRSVAPGTVVTVTVSKTC